MRRFKDEGAGTRFFRVESKFFSMELNERLESSSGTIDLSSSLDRSGQTSASDRSELVSVGITGLFLSEIHSARASGLFDVFPTGSRSSTLAETVDEHLPAGVTVGFAFLFHASIFAVE